jgi:hypothetical protein
MRYWTHKHNIRYEIDKRIERVCLATAARMPARVRMWAVVVSGYAGPDGLTYREIHDGALGSTS